MDSHHYGKRPVCRVSKLLPCANFRAHGKQTVCHVSSKKHTINCLPCARSGAHGKQPPTPPTHPPTHLTGTTSLPLLPQIHRRPILAPTPA